MRFQWAKYLYTSCNVSVNISTEIVWKGMYCRMLSKIIGLSKVKARGELSLKFPEFFGFSIFPIINRCLRGSNVVLSHLIFRVTSHLVMSFYLIRVTKTELMLFMGIWSGAEFRLYKKSFATIWNQLWKRRNTCVT